MRLFLAILLLTVSLRAETLQELAARASYIVGMSEIFTVAPTGSMVPTFDENYLVLVQRRSFKSIKTGDVIVFNRPDKSRPYLPLVVHRVWAISSNGTLILTKGDGNRVPDKEYVTKQDYVGLVVGWIRKD